jgi:hypothetical protein
VFGAPIFTPGQSIVAHEPSGEGFDTWTNLNDHISRAFRAFPLVRYPHGQARFLVHMVRLISGTMDRLMPGPGREPDLEAERLLAKTIERLASVLSLDAFFVALEIMRYRQMIGRE